MDRIPFPKFDTLASEEDEIHYHEVRILNLTIKSADNLYETESGFNLKTIYIIRYVSHIIIIVDFLSGI